MNKDYHDRKSVSGLAVVLIALLLAAAYGIGLLAIDWYDGRPMRIQEKKDEIRFLSAAQQLSQRYNLATDSIKNTLKTEKLIDEYWNTGNSTLTHSDVILINPEGEILDRNNNDPVLYIGIDQATVNWWNGYAYFTSPGKGMQDKYKVVVYDAEHWTGGAAAQGSFGQSPDKAPISVRRDLEVSGRMLIYIAEDAFGNSMYLVDFILPDASTGGYGITYSLTGTSNDTSALSAWLKAAKDIMQIAFPPLLILYWLLLPYWGYLDARRRGMRTDVWTPVLLVFNLPGLLVYLLAARAKERREAGTACAACGGSMLRAFPHCPWCGAPQRKVCPICSAEMQTDWTACPYCDGKPIAISGKPENPAPDPAAEEIPEPIHETEAVETAPPPPDESEQTPAIPAIFRDDWRDDQRSNFS